MSVSVYLKHIGADLIEVWGNGDSVLIVTGGKPIVNTLAFYYNLRKIPDISLFHGAIKHSSTILENVTIRFQIVLQTTTITLTMKSFSLFTNPSIYLKSFQGMFLAKFHEKSFFIEFIWSVQSFQRYNLSTLSLQ